MALVRGTSSLFPCPVCLVPRKELMAIWKKYKERTGEDMTAILQEARAAPNKAQAEKILKRVSLRPVEVCTF